jgi:photosystem II stability/assembly factor-like uncharacterized protein
MPNFGLINQLNKKVMKKITLLFSILCSWCTASAQWTNQDAGFSNRTLGFYEISIVNENVVWAICYDGIGGLGSGVPILDFTKTTDGGATWVPGTLNVDTSLAFSNICALSATEAWVAMHKGNFSTGGGIFHTTDGGATWQQSNPETLFGPASFPNFVYFKDQMNGIAGGDAAGGYFEIYTTSDGGVSWTRTPQANIPEPLAGGIGGWFDGFCVVGNNVWFGNNLGQMYKSTDFGQTWTIHTVDPTMNMIYEIAFNDDGLHGLTNIRLANNTVVLYSTVDGGLTWTQMTPTPQWKRSRVTSVPGTNTFVSTSVIYPNRGSAYTTDNGVTWVEIDGAVQKAACRFLNSTTGWAGGYYNDNPQYIIADGIYKWDGTVSLGIEENSMAADFKVFPSPANDILNVHLGRDVSTCDLQFYNAIGALVMEVSNTTGQPINIAELPSGVYFIKAKDHPGVNLKFIKK